MTVFETQSYKRMSFLKWENNELNNSDWSFIHQSSLFYLSTLTFKILTDLILVPRPIPKWINCSYRIIQSS